MDDSGTKLVLTTSKYKTMMRISSWMSIFTGAKWPSDLRWEASDCNNHSDSLDEDQMKVASNLIDPLANILI